jgi:ubiquinone/menaquinone biosynthesis C-methylase UbiE
MTGANDAQADFWEELAPAWLASEAHSEIVSQRFGVLAMDRLALQPGQRVLDVGCGSGATTLELARRVGPHGEALGADIAESMVAAAADRAEASQVANARFVQADVQVADLGEGTFDAAFSRFGVMFFSDPVSAFGNLKRALRPGGALAIACWQNVFANEWMLVPGAAVVSVTGALPPMPGPDEPGPFSLSDPAKVRQLLGAAGFRDVEVTPQAEVIVMPASQIDSMVELTSRVGPVREALRTADDETRSRILGAVHDALTGKVELGHLRLNAGAFVVTARA